eukprot:761459-Hanusia_phi.AAC.3
MQSKTKQNKTKQNKTQHETQQSKQDAKIIQNHLVTLREDEGRRKALCLTCSLTSAPCHPLLAFRTTNIRTRSNSCFMLQKIRT